MPSKHKLPSVRVIGPISIALITVAAIDSLRNLPIMAEYGFGIVFMLALGIITFFIPLALVCAELSTAWPKRGGIYVWVSEAFGFRVGFLAAWLQWSHNVPWYPAILAYIAATLAYTYDPSLATNTYYVLPVVLAILWLLTIANLFGMRISGLISSVGVIVGTIFPSVMLIALGASWFFSNDPNSITFSWGTFVPDMNMANIVFFISIVFSFAGLELSSTHAQEVIHPRRSYPLGYLFAVIIMMFLTIFGALSIAVVIPQSQLNIVTGVIATMEMILDKFDLHPYVSVMAGLIAIGGIATVSTWLYSALKALLMIAHHGHLPPIFSKTNKHDAPSNLLWVQALVTTFFCSIFVLLPTVASAFWFFSVMATQLYVIMYIILFLAAIHLRRKFPNKPRSFSIPGGNWGMYIVAGLGILSSLFVLIIGFFPPMRIKSGQLLEYDLLLVFGILILTLPPLIMYRFRRNSWRRGEFK